MTDNGSEIYLLVTVGTIVAVCFVIREIVVFISIKDYIKYVDREIERSDGEELRYWKREKRRAFLPLIPFFRIGKR